MVKQLKILTYFAIFMLVAQSASFSFGSFQIVMGNSSSIADAGPPSTFGNTAIGNYFDQNDPNAKSASNFTCDINGQITDIYAYVARADSTGTGEAAIYADDSGQPSALIAQSNAESITTSFSWVDFQLPTPKNVISGTVYWLSICSDDILSLYEVVGSGVRVQNGNTYSKGFSDPFGPIWGQPDPTGAMSIYASVIPISSKLSVTISPPSANIVLGGSQQFTSALTGGDSPFSYQWYLNDTAVSEAINQNWVFTPSTTGHYKVYLNVTDSLNNEAQSNTAMVVYPSLYNFSIMQITDTQFLSSTYPDLYKQLTTWIVNNNATYNLKMVVHTGDIVDQYDDASQWQNANDAMTILTNKGIPYTWDAGNHDQIDMNNPNSGWLGRQYTAFNPATFRGTSYWVGDSVQGKNTAVKFSFSGYNFLVINLECEANASAMAWATNLLDTYSSLNYNIIVATHAYLASPNSDFNNDLPYAPAWEQNLQSLLNNYSRVFLTLNGHTSIDPAINVHNQVNGRTQVEFNDQYNNDHQGSCSARIYSFNLNDQTVDVSTYSVWNSTWLTESMDSFSFSTNLTSIPTVTIAPTHVRMYLGQSQTFSSSISGVEPPFSYRWYLNDTAVSEATSSTWTFTPTQIGHYNIYLDVTDSQNNQTQSNIITDIRVYNQSQMSSLTPDWNNVTQDFFDLVPGAANPVLTAANVTDRAANFVADPFIFHEGNSWYMFFEVETGSGTEEIGVATSSDGFNWIYQKIVLSDPSIVLSYPYVFKWEGIYYMIPNTYPWGVMLYKATDFPYTWTLVNTLISNQNFTPADSSIFRYNNTWWMFTGNPDDLRLFYSYNLTDPTSWHEHPMSPILVNDPSEARGGGRVIVFDSGRIIRLAQKDDIAYGEAVRAFEIDTLNETYFAEHEITESPIVSASGSGWNSHGMHTVDPWWSGNSWIAAVDGTGDNLWSIGIYVTPLQTVTISPTDVRIDLGQSQTFSSFISGGKPSYSYQWYLNDTAVSDATNPTWTFTPTETGNYKVYVNVTDSLGTKVQSTNVTDIIVYPLATALISPSSVKMTVGTTQQFNSTATGGLLPYTFQWYLNETAVPGANSSNWNFTPETPGQYEVYLNVTDAASFEVQSNIVTDITVYPQPIVAIIPTSVNMSVESSQTFSSNVTGGTTPYLYQWYLNGTAIPEATSANWIFTPLSAGTYNIYLNVTDNSAVTVESNTSTASVESPITANISPTQVKMYVGQNQTFNSSISGGILPYTYQWYLNDTAVSGATNSNWNFTPMTAGSYRVYLKITDGLNFKVQSNTITNITVYSQLATSISPVSMNMTVGTPQTFTSTVLGGAMPYTYKWYLNESQVPNADSSTWTFTPTSDGNFNIYLIVADNKTASAQSNNATVTVETATNVSISPIQVKIDLGQSQTFNSTVSGGTQPYSYQWYLNDSAVLGGMSQNWTFMPTTAGHYQIYLNVTDALNIKVQSNIVTDVTVFSLPIVSISPTTVNMTVGTAQTFTSIVLGGVQPYSYQWCLNGSEVPGATSSSWTFIPTTNGTYNIYLNVTDYSKVTAQSNHATAMVETITNVSISPIQVKMYVGQSQTFNSTVSNGNEPYSYQWYLNDTAVPGASSRNWTFTPTMAGVYEVYLNITDALNLRVQSNIVTDITVFSLPTVAISPVSVNMTVNTKQTFNSTATGGLGPYTYQWYLNGSQVSNATGNSWTFNATTAGTYMIYLRITDNLTAIVQSDNATARVETPMNVTIIPTQLKIYIGQSETFSSSVSGGLAPYAYQWYLNDNAVSGATSQNWNFTPTSTGNISVYLNVTDALDFKVQSNIVTEITVYPELIVSISPTSANITVGTPQTFTSTVLGGSQPYTYQWYLNGSLVSNANSVNWTFTPTSAGNFIIYLIVADNNNASAQSNNATFTVGTTLVITGFIVESGGSGYTTPAVILMGGGGTGATATARVSNGVIYGIILTNPGSGYTSAPTVSFRDPSPRAKGAAATATLAT